MFYGKGAGKLPTASAVVGDVIDAAKADKQVFLKLGRLAMIIILLKAINLLKLLCISELQQITLNKLKLLLKNFLVTLQYLTKKTASDNELAFVTPEIVEKEIDDCIEKIEMSGANVIGKIRILDI